MKKIKGGNQYLIPERIKQVTDQKLSYYFKITYADKLNSRDVRYEFILKAEGRYQSGLLMGVNFTLGGNGKRNCVQASVIRSQELGILDTVAYHEGCALNQMFIEGHSMIMVKIMMDIIHKYYPWAIKTKIEDLSTTPCGNSNVYLHLLLIAFRGQTWYESNLGAIMNDDIMKHQEYRKSIEIFENKNIKGSFDDFCQIYKIDSNNDKLREIYNTSTTYNDFIANLKKDYLNIPNKTKKEQRDNFCQNVMPWLENIMSENIYFDKIWYVDMIKRKDPFIDGYSIELLKETPELYKGGGKIKQRTVFKKSNGVLSVLDE